MSYEETARKVAEILEESKNWRRVPIDRSKNRRWWGRGPPFHVAMMLGRKADLPPEYQKRRPMSLGEYSVYEKKVDESGGGFDVSGCADLGLVCCGISEARGDDLSLGAKAAKFAVTEHNKEERYNASPGRRRGLRLLEAEKINVQIVNGVVYYITLRALDMEDNQQKRYHAKVYVRDMTNRPGFTGNKFLKSFQLAPQQPPQEPPQREKKQKHGPPQESPGPSKRSKRSPEESRSKHKRPFNVFVDVLRKEPEFADKPYQEVVKVAGTKWRAMRAEEKALYGEMVAPSP